MKDLCLTDESFVKLKSLVLHENLRQLEKWGVQDHLPSEWIMFATKELGETAKAIGEFTFRGGLAEDVVKEAIQTATLILKIAEMFQDLLIKQVNIYEQKDTGLTIIEKRKQWRENYRFIKRHTSPDCGELVCHTVIKRHP